jgi:HTH-type transcriptional regulator / antitoxin HigA
MTERGVYYSGGGPPMVDAAEPVPDKAIPPSNLLAEELEYRGMTPAQLAGEMGWTEEATAALVEGRAPMTAEAAAALERALGIDSGLWLHLQTAYEADLARLTPAR